MEQRKDEERDSMQQILDQYAKSAKEKELMVDIDPNSYLGKEICRMSAEVCRLRGEIADIKKMVAGLQPPKNKKLW